MKLMYDSVTASDIPAGAAIVAGYVDGIYKWSDADWARFPDALKVRIAVFASTNDGDVLDCETGDATPQQCPGWIKMRQAAGLAVPTIYCGASLIPIIKSVCAGLTFDIWSADYTGVPHINGGAIATQYADPRYGSGGHYDLTLCSAEWPRVPAPVPTAAPATTDDLINALAYVCDTLGDRVDALLYKPLHEVQDEITAIEAEMTRVRDQFIGVRP